MSYQAEITTKIQDRVTLLSALKGLGIEEVIGTSIKTYGGNEIQLKIDDIKIGDKSAFIKTTDNYYKLSTDLFYDDNIRNVARRLEIKNDREEGIKDFTNIVSNLYNNIKITKAIRQISPQAVINTNQNNLREIVITATL